MAGLRNYVITFVLVGLFMFSMFSFITNLQSENSAAVQIVTDPTVSNLTSSLTSGLETFDDIANEQRGGFEREEASVGLGELVFKSITGVGKVIGAVTITFYDIFGAAALLIGVPVIVINVLAGILVMTLVFLAWRLYRTGE